MEKEKKLTTSLFTDKDVNQPWRFVDDPERREINIALKVSLLCYDEEYDFNIGCKQSIEQQKKDISQRILKEYDAAEELLFDEPPKITIKEDEEEVCGKHEPAVTMIELYNDMYANYLDMEEKMKILQNQFRRLKEQSKLQNGVISFQFGKMSKLSDTLSKVGVNL